MKLFRKVLFFLIISIATSVFARQIYHFVLKPNISAISPWLGSYDDIFMAFRSNAPHYWFWLRGKSSPLMQVQGVVAGDPHILNFGDIQLRNGAREYGLVDMDDVGLQGPLLGDFLRYFIGNRVSPFRCAEKQLINAYLAGLQNHHRDKPDFLKEVEEKSPGDFLARQKRFLDKITHDRRFNEKAGLHSLEQMPEAVARFYAEAQPVFGSLMQDFEVLDSGFKIKETGGSRGLPRFWFLLKDLEGQKHVWEFKQQKAPAISYYRPEQGSSQERFVRASRYYRPTDILGPYQLVDFGTVSYLLRERFDNYIDLDPSKMVMSKEIEAAKEMSLYLAYKMGYWQALQPEAAALRDLLGQEVNQEELKNLAEEYIEVMQKLMSKKP